MAIGAAAAAPTIVEAFNLTRKCPDQRDRDIERRSAPRYVLTTPIRFVIGVGITRDVSATGLRFETSIELKPGDPIHLTIENPNYRPGGARYAFCHGEVVRVVRRAGEAPRFEVGVATARPIFQ